MESYNPHDSGTITLFHMTDDNDIVFWPHLLTNVVVVGLVWVKAEPLYHKEKHNVVVLYGMNINKPLSQLLLPYYTLLRI